MAPMKEQIKAPEKIQLSIEEIPKLSEAQFKTLVIRRLTEMAEYGHKIEEKVKVMKREIKGTNMKGRKPRLKSKVWICLFLLEEINIQPEQNKEITIQKNEERLRDQQDIFQHSNI